MCGREPGEVLSVTARRRARGRFLFRGNVFRTLAVPNFITAMVKEQSTGIADFVHDLIRRNLLIADLAQVHPCPVAGKIDEGIATGNRPSSMRCCTRKISSRSGIGDLVGMAPAED
jgi:hypothetical protein